MFELNGSKRRALSGDEGNSTSEGAYLWGKGPACKVNAVIFVTPYATDTRCRSSDLRERLLCRVSLFGELGSLNCTVLRHRDSALNSL